MTAAADGVNVQKSDSEGDRTQSILEIGNIVVKDYIFKTSVLLQRDGRVAHRGRWQ